jgi:N-acetylneuraminic acid mutarotase
LIKARDEMGVTQYCGKIYAIGGWSCSSLNNVEVYDPVKKTWKKIRSMPTARDRLAAVTYNEKIYAIGGRDSDENSLDMVEIYDPKKDEWTEANSFMPTPRRWAGIAEYEGKIYVIGGEDDNFNAVNVVEDYVPGVKQHKKEKNQKEKPNLLGTISGKK